MIGRRGAGSETQSLFGIWLRVNKPKQSAYSQSICLNNEAMREEYEQLRALVALYGVEMIR